ncbi:MAG: hypothetical protein ACLFTT_11180 [Candidatus Hydrogenedentota bacterium]
MSEQTQNNTQDFQGKVSEGMASMRGAYAEGGAKGLLRNRAFQLTVGAAVVCLLALSMCGSGTGTITFAEEVDDNLDTKNEGTEFSTGRVHMVIRGTEPFSDSTLTVFVRESGTEAWAPFEQHTVSAEWDTYAAPVLLDETGDYDIKVETSGGKKVAEGTVHIR